jgi:hypothetical protein
MTDFQPDEPLAQAVTVAYEPLAFTVMTWVALPTLTGTGKFGAAGAALCLSVVPPAPAWAREAVDVGDVLPEALADADAEAEGDAEAEAEGEAEGLADEGRPDPSVAPLETPGTDAAEPAGSWPPQADTSDIAPATASTAGRLRDEESTM